MAVVRDILRETWLITEAMAPYLLLGFLMAGVLSAFVSKSFVERHLGRRSFWQICKASLLGVPLPLCSCGVLPVSASLRRHGAGKGATLSFLVSTPQTGMDSILATQALLGPVFVVFRIVTAFVTGIVSGVLVELIAPTRDEPAAARETCPRCQPNAKRGHVRRMLVYGFGTLPREIGRAMLLGILLSGILTALVPENYLSNRLGPDFVSMVIVMIVGIPLYVCSTGSIPIAFAFMKMGISPGAALVFLVTGPATNAAALATIWSVLGKRATAVYLGTIALGGLAAGLLLDLIVTRRELVELVGPHHAGPRWPKTFAAVVLLLLLTPSLLRRRKRPLA